MQRVCGSFIKMCYINSLLWLLLLLFLKNLWELLNADERFLWAGRPSCHPADSVNCQRTVTNDRLDPKSSAMSVSHIVTCTIFSDFIFKHFQVIMLKHSKWILLVCWWWMVMIWLVLHVLELQLLPLTTSIILSSNKIQNGDIRFGTD